MLFPSHRKIGILAVAVTQPAGSCVQRHLVRLVHVNRISVREDPCCQPCRSIDLTINKLGYQILIARAEATNWRELMLPFPLVTFEVQARAGVGPRPKASWEDAVMRTV